MTDGPYVTVIDPPADSVYTDPEFLFTDEHAEAVRDMPVYDVFGDRVGLVTSATVEPDGRLVLMYETTVPGMVSIEATPYTITAVRLVKTPKVHT